MLQIAIHNKPYFAAAQGTWDVLQDVSAVLDDNLLGTTPRPVVEVCRVSCAVCRVPDVSWVAKARSCRCR